jgi:hypothetical protein
MQWKTPLCSNTEQLPRYAIKIDMGKGQERTLQGKHGIVNLWTGTRNSGEE